METVEDLCDHIALINKVEKKILRGHAKTGESQFSPTQSGWEHRGAFSFVAEAV